jgi:hypothetical protein
MAVLLATSVLLDRPRRRVAVVVEQVAPAPTLT